MEDKADQDSVTPLVIPEVIAFPGRDRHQQCRARRPRVVAPGRALGVAVVIADMSQDALLRFLRCPQPPARPGYCHPQQRRAAAGDPVDGGPAHAERPGCRPVSADLSQPRDGADQQPWPPRLRRRSKKVNAPRQDAIRCLRPGWACSSSRTTWPADGATTWIWARAAAARRWARVMAQAPADARETVALRSTTRTSTPRLMMASPRASLSWSAGSVVNAGGRCGLPLPGRSTSPGRSPGASVPGAARWRGASVDFGDFSHRGHPNLRRDTASLAAKGVPPQHELSQAAAAGRIESTVRGHQKPQPGC